MSDSHSDNSQNRYSRREFLKTSALSSMAVGPFILNGCSTNVFDNGTFTQKGKAKNIIFMVSDGMSAGTLNMADMLKFRIHGERSHWINLYRSKRNFHRGLMDMASLDSLVTDSAAAGSSWACGNRVNNGAINVGPGGEQYPPINQFFKDAGKKTGLVTTTRITHATPAAFSVNIADRNEEDRIAELYLERGYDLLMGGGARHFEAGEREDGKDLLQQFSENDYQIALDKKQLQKATADNKLLGLFYDDHMPYSIDHQSTPEYRKSIPTISEMTQKALQQLENEQGFILQVEGGRVDHGAHANDASAMLYDQIEFDDAVKVAIDYVDQRDDTLLIITTDHGNANPGLNGAGPSYRDTNKKFENMKKVRYSNTWALSELNGNSSTSDIRDRIEYATRIVINKKEAEALKKAFNDDLETLYNVQNTSDAVLGSILANYTAINFTSGNHTSDYVELAALGPGSSNLNYFTRNTELFDFMLQTAGIEHKQKVEA